MPDWGKIEFYKYPAQPWDDILKGASSNGRDLVSHLVKYESSERYSATEVRETTILCRAIKLTPRRPYHIHTFSYLRDRDSNHGNPRDFKL